MKVKRVLKVIGVILIILILMFLIHALKNFIIITKLRDKVAKYMDSTNYHITTISNQKDAPTVTINFYNKNEKQVMSVQREDENGEITKLTFYCNGERTDMFVESPTEKIATIDSKISVEPIVVINPLQADNKWQTFLYSSISFIKNANYEGKDCYIVDNYLSPYSLVEQDNTTTKYIIEKDTGLLLKTETGNLIGERKYEFGNVDDYIFVEPDISQYKIQENN